MDIKEKVIVEISYLKFEFYDVVGAIAFAKNCIEHGVKTDISDVEVSIVFEEREEKEDE